MNIIIRWIVGVIAVWLTVTIGDKLGLGLHWPGFLTAAWFVLVLAVCNALIRPIVKLLTLPLNCLTFGLLSFVINALIFWLAASVSGSNLVTGFWGALFGSVVLAVISGIMNSFVKRQPRE